MPGAGILGLLFCLAAAIAVWRDSMRAREAAVGAARAACRSYSVQFLDDTVSLAHLGLARGGRLGLCVRRAYEFELSPDGVSRRSGSVTVAGGRVISLYLPEVDAGG